MAKDHLLFGVGDSNILEYASQHIPEEMREQSPDMFANMHNIYLQILVGSGVIALLLFVVFAAWFLLKGAKRLYCGSWRGQDYPVILLLFGLLVGILVENLFDSNLLGFMCFFIVPIFWTYCGYYIRLVWQEPEDTGDLTERNPAADRPA